MIHTHKCFSNWHQSSNLEGCLGFATLGISIQERGIIFLLLCHTWCGYEVSGMILLCDLQGAIWLDHSDNMSVHVSTCNN